MPCSKDYVEFVRERLSRLDSVTVRPMMGAHVIHYAGRVLGFIVGESLLFEDGPVMRKLLPSAERMPLFPGSKDFVLMDDSIPSRRLCEIAGQAYEDLPLPKPHRSGRRGRTRPGTGEKACSPFAQFGDAPEFD